MLAATLLSSVLIPRQRMSLNEQCFRAITENTTNITVIVNPDGSYRYTSPSLDVLLGESAAQTRGLLDDIHADDVASVASAIARTVDMDLPVYVRAFRCRGQWHRRQLSRCDRTAHLRTVDAHTLKCRGAEPKRRADCRPQWRDRIRQPALHPDHRLQQRRGCRCAGRQPLCSPYHRRCESNLARLCECRHQLGGAPDQYPQERGTLLAIRLRLTNSGRGGRAWSHRLRYRGHQRAA